MRKYYIEIIIAVGMIIILFAPWLFTRTFGLFAFSDTGEIGDTIGGITAPITSLLGSLLVYFALKAQIDANKLVFNQFEFQKTSSYITDQITLLRDDIDKITLTTTRNSTLEGIKLREKIPYVGTEAIEHYFMALSNIPAGHTSKEASSFFYELRHIERILARFIFLSEKITKLSLNENDKSYFKDLIIYTYETRIKEPLNLILYQNGSGS